MKLVQEMFEELETKAKAASVMGERIELDPRQLLALIRAARGKRESLDLVETGDLKPGYYEFSHTLYMVGQDFRFKGPFETLEEARGELGISQVEIDQAFFSNGRGNPNEFDGHSEQTSECADNPDSENIRDVEKNMVSGTGMETKPGVNDGLDNQNDSTGMTETYEQLHPEDLPDHIR